MNDFKNHYYDILDRTLENFKLTMETGIPELDMPPLDPINIDLIDFKFFNMTIEFVNIFMKEVRYFTNMTSWATS